MQGRNMKNHEFALFLSCLNSVKECMATLGIYLNNKKLAHLEEDFEVTLESLGSKSSIQHSRKQTVKLAEKFYLTRLYEICKAINDQVNAQKAFSQSSSVKNANSKNASAASTANNQDDQENADQLVAIKKLYEVMGIIRSENQYSFCTQEEFQNPYPAHLLFSQKYHGPHFSSKSGRDYVQGKSVTTMAAELKEGEISPGDLRINAYLAPWRGETSLFAHNNRTLATFSRARVPATRVVPILPTQDLMNRIDYINAVAHNPNTIIQERDMDDKNPESKAEAGGYLTRSQKPKQFRQEEEEEEKYGSAASSAHSSSSHQHRRNDASAKSRGSDASSSVTSTHSLRR